MGVRVGVGVPASGQAHAAGVSPSMQAVWVPYMRRQSRNAAAVSSGSLSMRRCAGAPRSATRHSTAATTPSPVGLNGGLQATRGTCRDRACQAERGR